MSEKMQNYIDLSRIKKPIGYMLLFWPCLWGLTIAYDFNDSIKNYLFYAFLFFLGSLLMRTAGCVVNDVVDRKLDSKVLRTKNRPIASNKISVFEGLLFASSLCILALIVLIQFNSLTVIMALASMPLAFSYPYMKRFTYWPQLYLGITFNYGLLLGWTSVLQNISIEPLIFYFGAIFWTLGYDTIYGYQDIKDDEIIGIKSTSIKFKQNPKIFLTICYLITFISILTMGYLMSYNYIFYVFFIVTSLHLLWQIKVLNISEGLTCLRVFKSNNLFGLFVFISILTQKIIPIIV